MTVKISGPEARNLFAVDAAKEWAEIPGTNPQSVNQVFSRRVEHNVSDDREENSFSVEVKVLQLSKDSICSEFFIINHGKGNVHELFIRQKMSNNLFRIPFPVRMGARNKYNVRVLSEFKCFNGDELGITRPNP